eukprot:11004409-Heterocapsa_arctica.AAC.1
MVRVVCPSIACGPRKEQYRNRERARQDPRGHRELQQRADNAKNQSPSVPHRSTPRSDTFEPVGSKDRGDKKRSKRPLAPSFVDQPVKTSDVRVRVHPSHDGPAPTLLLGINEA